MNAHDDLENQPFLENEGTPKRLDRYMLLLLCGYSILLGSLVGGVTWLFLQILHELEILIWEIVPETIFGDAEILIYPLIVCILGGFLVGVCQKYLGDYPKDLHDALNDVRNQGGFDYKHIPQGVILSLISLGFGGSLGPEAALIGLTGGLGTWVAMRIKLSARYAHASSYIGISSSLGAFFTSPLGSAVMPLESAEDMDIPSSWIIAPGVLAGLSGLFMMIILPNGFGFSFEFIPYISPKNGFDLLISIPIAVVGGLLGWLYLKSEKTFQQLMTPLKEKLVIRGICGGVVLGTLATFFPLVLISGQSSLQTILTEGEQLGIIILILTALGKLIATSFILSTGWKGGQFFPIMFGGGSARLAISYLFPVIHPMVGFSVVMAAATGAVLRRPLAVILILVIMLPANLLIVISSGAVIGSLFTRRISLEDQDNDH